MPAKTVLLTGSHGFTGRYVKEALQQAGYRVAGLVQHAPAEDEVAADLTDLPALCDAVNQIKPDFVIHLAAIAFVAHADQMGLYQTNVFGTLNLLDALHRSGLPLQKVILASSANIYGNPPVSPVVEDTPPAPVNHYAMSKLAMEHMARTWLDRLPILFTRPFNYTGAGQDEKFLIPKIVAHFKRKDGHIKLGNLDVVREFNDVRMVAQAYVRLLTQGQAGDTVNLCTGRGHRLLDVVETVSQLSGHTLQVEVDPQLVRANELKILIGSPDKLKAVLPDLPDYSLQDTLGWMLAAQEA